MIYFEKLLKKKQKIYPAWRVSAALFHLALTIRNDSFILLDPIVAQKTFPIPIWGPRGFKKNSSDHSSDNDDPAWIKFPFYVQEIL